MNRRSRRQESWPEPRSELLASLEEDLRTPSRRRTPRQRVALASAISIVFLAVFAGLGGVGSAASSLAGIGTSATASDDQYGYPQWVCVTKPHASKPKFKLFYAGGPGDFDGWTLLAEYGQTPGPCPPA